MLLKENAISGTNTLVKSARLNFKTAKINLTYMYIHFFVKHLMLQLLPSTSTPMKFSNLTDTIYLVTKCFFY